MSPLPNANLQNRRRLGGAMVRWLALWCGALGWVLFCGSPARAQGGLALSHQAWSTEEGLPDATVHRILQSRVGYLWLATENGAVRFDGTSFRVLRHETAPAFTSDDVGSVAEDSAGTLWFGTADGLIADREGSLQRYDARDGLPSPYILDLAAAGDGSVVVATDAGVVRVQGRRVKPLQPVPPFAVTALQPAPEGGVWLVSSQGKTAIYRNGAVKAELRRLDEQGPPVAVCVGPQGALLVATAHAIDLLGGTSRRLWPVTPQQAQLRVTALLPDRQKGVWIGTNHGLYREDLQGVPRAELIGAMGGESVLALTADREGDVWIGTQASGLHVLRPRAFRSAGAVAGEAITAVAAARGGGVWLGTRDNGVRHLRADGSPGPAPSAEQLTSPRVLSLAEGEDGELWVGTPDGLNQVDAANDHVRRLTSADGLPDDFVRTLLVGERGVVWAGTRRGLVRLEHGGLRVLTRSEGLPSDSIGPLLAGVPGTGQLWVGTSDGLALVRNGRVSPGVPMSHAIITALANDGAGGLWVGVHGRGLFHAAGSEIAPVSARGLPIEISAMALDGAGDLWLRGAQDVFRASSPSLLRCTKLPQACRTPVSVLGVADGMPSQLLAAEGSPEIATSADGQLWFSTQKGVAIADPAHLPLPHAAPPVVVQRLAVDGVDVGEGPETLRVRPGYGRYVFDYAALSYRLPSKVRYRYRLDGFDRDWVEAGTARSAVYTRLAPGLYRFHVTAEDGDGLWSDPGGVLSFRVLPPFYRRWWFYLMAVLLAGALVAAGLHLRDLAVQRRFALVLEERNRMAREIHDTLAQDFVSVSLQLDLASNHLRGERYNEAAAQLQTTRTLVKEGLQAARQSIWNLRANAGETSLPTRLTQLAARYSVAGKPPQVSIGGAFRKLPAGVEEEVLRVAGEALSNVDRHAHASFGSVDLRYEPQWLTLRVRDDGRGFDPETARRAEGHYGVRGLFERAAGLQGELRIMSSPGQGTTVTLRVPLGAGE